MLALFLSLLFILAPCIILAESIETYRIHHRFLSHPSPQSPPTFRQLGSVQISQSSNSFTTTLEDSLENVAEDLVDDGKGWYQVGLQLSEGHGVDEWFISSTKYCYLSSSSPKIKIHLSESSIPTSLSIHPTAPSQSSCSSNSSESIKLPSKINELQFEFPRHTHKIYSPSLAAPPALDPSTGSPAQPEQEKSFAQKYWMYIVGLALFFAVQMGPDDKPAAAGSGGGAK
ncbi:uncharacterized protein IL334_003050 [Kwoniella shivajii]|uniref:ER membrane protein complex subunit 10 n=1 Tax=Kwoniella shivajii TaxID=564305 RepID=A0ABZ1CWF6_9TREE|nr:hypothetical protein IL334_003050 [Kwoniella shivajii]